MKAMSPTRQKLHQLASAGHRAPIGTHLVLHEKPDAGEIVKNGAALGGVIVETAKRFNTPLAVPLMDLTIEKEALLLTMGVEPDSIASFQFSQVMDLPSKVAPTPRMETACSAIRTAAAHPDLLPMGMGIGPFSLMTKLLSDPITPVFLAGSGMSPEDEPDIEIVLRCIEAGTKLVMDYLAMQVDAGAQAVIVCEPAANLVYFSPNQLAENFEIFDRLVTEPMKKVRAMLAEKGAELVFHDCGELTTEMISRFAELDPAMVSLGGSRVLWEDAPLFSKDTVMYGNLPSKRFYSPQLTVEEVRETSRAILGKMAETGHPFILGSECDVLSVPGSEAEILAKVEAFLSA